MSNNAVDFELCLKMAKDLFGLEKMPCLDTEQIELLSAAAGDSAAEFYDEIIETFKSECDPRLDALVDACAAKNLNDIKRHIHFIAGSSANIGLGRLSKLCRNIEKQCDDGVFTEYDACTTVVKQEMQTAIDQIHALLAR